MSATTLLLFIGLYFAVLILIGHFTAQKDSNDTFFRGNRNSPWYVVAFGMIGASLSGVTFISVPGWVAGSQFSYLQTVLGYLVGYATIAWVLLPLYYRLNLTTIYTYLGTRFGPVTYRTGAWFFLISRLLGSAFRLYIVAEVLHFSIFEALNVPFSVVVAGTLLLIMAYTSKGGIRTIVYTDTLQTAFMLIAVALTIYHVQQAVVPNDVSLLTYLSQSPDSQTFFFSDFLADKRHFIKQFFSGVFLAIAMTGLDQDMMQKNLTCKNLKDAQKNMLWFSTSLVFVNLMFLSLGILLYDFAALKGLAAAGDKLYPSLALGGYLGPVVGVFFIVGLIAAAYSSADSALTSLTTSFCIDILQIDQNQLDTSLKTRKRVHWLVALAMFLVIVGSKPFVSANIISTIFEVAGYTYGPLLGFFGFGLLTHRTVNDKWVWLVALLTPAMGYGLKLGAAKFLHYNFSFELLLINGLLTAAGLWLLSKPKSH